MVICGLNKTYMFGPTHKVLADFANIVHAVTEGLTQKYSRQDASDLVIGCVKMVLLAETAKGPEFEREFVNKLVEVIENQVKR